MFQIPFGKNFLSDFLRKKLKIRFSQDDPDENLYFFDFPLLCNHADLGHETCKKS